MRLLDLIRDILKMILICIMAPLRPHTLYRGYRSLHERNMSCSSGHSLLPFSEQTFPFCVMTALYTITLWLVIMPIKE